MIDLAAARVIADDVLARFAEHPGVPELVVTRWDEREVGWIFHYQSKRYIESGDRWAMVAGNAPIIVDRSNGRPHVTGTARSVDFYIEELTAGRHTCELCA